jgi:ribonuclease HII
VATLEFEQQLYDVTSFENIAGIDEAGRGALAGPVAAAAVILPLGDPVRLARLSAVNDSKTLSAKKRDYFYDLIIENAVAYGIGSASSIRIDREGIVSATKHAMREAVAHLLPTPDYLLIDGRIRLATLPISQKSIIRGDSKSLSIAAASILAKVTRDRFMVALAELYPQYGFDRHKGYATPEHLSAIIQYGPINLHRHSFAPVRRKLLD